MPRKVTKDVRGGETIKDRKKRLQEEGVWHDYLMERNNLYDSGRDKKETMMILETRYGKGCTPEDRKDYLVIDGIEIRGRYDYKNGMEKLQKQGNTEMTEIKPNVKPEVDTSKIGTAKKDTRVNVPEKAPRKYENRLPDGCPLFDPEDFDGETDLFANATWTDANLARNDITEDNVHEHAPSLSCAAYWWSARYTTEGYHEHRSTMGKLTIADKSNLKRMNSRDDDGGSLDRLDKIIANVKKLQLDGNEEQE